MSAKPAAISCAEVDGRDLWLWNGGPQAFITCELLKQHGIQEPKPGELIEFGPWSLKVLSIAKNEIDGPYAVVERIAEVHA